MKYIIFLMFAVLILMPIVFADLTSEIGFNLKVSGGIICENNGNSWGDYTGDVKQNIPTIGPNGNCFQANGKNILGQDQSFCCPLGSSCKDAGFNSITGMEQYVCHLDVRLTCPEFNKSEDDCENTTFDIANRTITNLGGYCGYNPNYWIDNGRMCYNISDCYCSWQLNNNNRHVCKAVQDVETECSGNGPETGTSVGNCTFERINYDDKCLDEGYITEYWKATPEGENPPEGCVDKTIRIECSQVVKMDFFNEYTLIMTILGLIGIYSFLNWKSKNE